jgi:hypothetical protein
MHALLVYPEDEACADSVADHVGGRFDLLPLAPLRGKAGHSIAWEFVCQAVVSAVLHPPCHPSAPENQK